MAGASNRAAGPRRRPLDPDRVVASFDSASALHAAGVAALNGRGFANLGSSRAAGAAVRLAGHLPWPLLRSVYARIGGAEGVRPDRLDRVDLGGVAASLAAELPRRRYPAALLGASNGALSHLAAAMQIPWLPNTVLIPVHHVGDPRRADLALEFGRSAARPLLEANPQVTLHQMHDSAQDELMAARMAYFRTKYRSMPGPYQHFLEECLAPGAPVFIADDRSRWPVTRVGERHVFQTGGRGGLTPAEHLALPHTPAPDDTAPEAEWGSDPGFVEAVQRWCAEHGHPSVLLGYDGPQAPAGGVARLFRAWYADQGRRTDRLIVPSFVLGDPWRTLQTSSVPFWTYFGVQEAFAALRAHLSAAEPYRDVYLLLFQHGANSPGRVGPEAWRDLVEQSGARPHLVGLHPRASPHDIGLLGRYGDALNRISNEPQPWSPLCPARAIRGLQQAAGIEVSP